MIFDAPDSFPGSCAVKAEPGESSRGGTQNVYQRIPFRRAVREEDEKEG